MAVKAKLEHNSGLTLENVYWKVATLTIDFQGRWAQAEVRAYASQDAANTGRLHLASLPLTFLLSTEMGRSDPMTFEELIQGGVTNELVARIYQAAKATGKLVNPEDV